MRDIIRTLTVFISLILAGQYFIMVQAQGTDHSTRGMVEQLKLEIQDFQAKIAQNPS